MDVLSTEGAKKGTRWDDIVFYFEWTFEVDKISKDAKLEVNIGELVQDVNYRCNFDYETIIRWHR